MKKLYIFDPTIKWKSFKKIQDACNKANNEQGPYGANFDKNLWKMVKEKMIYVGFTKKPFEMLIMTKWPEGYEVYMVGNPPTLSA